MKSTQQLLHGAIAILVLSVPIRAGCAQNSQPRQDLDTRVRRFLDDHRTSWEEDNVPFSDGQALYDLVVANGFTRALEIGTSTGRSGIWIAWALSKTGGKLTTVEIDEDRYHQALAHFEEAGLSEYVDARLANAHELVPALPGPFDFIFLDADKDWYPQYFRDVLPKLEIGGCFTAHNVSERQRPGHHGTTPGARALVQELLATPNLVTEFDTGTESRGGGISVSCKREGS